MLGLEQYEQIGRAGGIDQSENPRPNTVHDVNNIQTVNGRWQSRPGFQFVNNGWAVETLAIGNLFAEYLFDARYSQSSYRNTIIIGYHRSNLTQRFKVKSGNTWSTLTPTGVTLSASNAQKKFGYVRSLRQYEREGGGDTPATKYTPCLVFGNGEDPTLVYHQADSGTDKIEALESVDGGFSDQTYLDEPPRAKFFVEHKNRIFALNTSDSSNRVYHTGPNDAGVWTANVWPGTYNFDVGDGTAITGAVSIGDQMLIFKENEIWSLSGEGFDGAWSLQRIDAQNGSLPHCVIYCEHGLFFMNRQGVYRWDNGVARRISHPRLQKSWAECTWDDANGKFRYALYDPREKRILFSISYRNDLLAYFVYNIEADTWDRWGEHPGSAYKVMDSAQIVYFPSWGGVATRWDGSVQELILMGKGPLLTLQRQGVDAYWDGSPYEYAVHWYIHGNEIFKKDNEHKHIIDAVIYGKKTGKWKLKFVPCFDGKGLVESWMYGVPSDQYNIVVDDVIASREHEVNTPVNLGAQYDGVGKVRMYDMRLMGESHYFITRDKYLDTPTGAGKVKVDDAEEVPVFLGFPPGTVLYCLSHVDLDTLPTPKPVEEILFDMYDSDDALFDDSGTTWDNSFYVSELDEKFTQTVNRYGTRVRIYLTNIATLYMDGVDDPPTDYNFAKHTILDVAGWGFWYRRRGFVKR